MGINGKRNLPKVRRFFSRALAWHPSEEYFSSASTNSIDDHRSVIKRERIQYHEQKKNTGAAIPALLFLFLQ
jgi:hypothetical protein